MSKKKDSEVVETGQPEPNPAETAEAVVDPSVEAEKAEGGEKRKPELNPDEMAEVVVDPSVEAEAAEDEGRRKKDPRFNPFMSEAYNALVAGLKPGVLVNALVEAIMDDKGEKPFVGMTYGARKAAVDAAVVLYEDEDLLTNLMDMVRKHIDGGGRWNFRPHKLAYEVLQGGIVKPETRFGHLVIACEQVIPEYLDGWRAEAKARRNAAEADAVDRIRGYRSGNQKGPFNPPRFVEGQDRGGKHQRDRQHGKGGRR